MRKILLILMTLTFLSQGLHAAESKPAAQPSMLAKALDSVKKAAAKDKASKESEKNKKRTALPAPSEEDVKAKGEMAQVEGVVVARNNRGMAVEYETDAVTGAVKEIWVNYHTKAKVTGLKSLTDIREDDLVRVKYKLTEKTKRIHLESVVHLGKKPKEEPLPVPAEETNKGEEAAGLAVSGLKP